MRAHAPASTPSSDPPSLLFLLQRLRQLFEANLDDVGHDAVALRAEERQRLAAGVNRLRVVAERGVAEREVVERVSLLLAVGAGADGGQRVAQERERPFVVPGGPLAVARTLVEVAGLRQREALAGHVRSVAVDLDGAADVLLGVRAVLQFEVDAAR